MIQDDYSNFGNNFSLIPVWNPIQQINFPFYFNGQLETAFKVSSTGILTFDTLATTAPAAMHATLPQSQIPDKSICLLGLNATFSNSYHSYIRYSFDQVNYQTSVPSKQLWIMFGNYTDTVTNSYYRITSWSIVLEEHTNNIYFVEQLTGTDIHLALTLGIQTDSATAFMAPGSPFITSHTLGNKYSSDNVYYAFIPGNEINNDGIVLYSGLQNYQRITDAPFTVRPEFRNMGSDTIHSLRLNYKINGGVVFSESFSGLNIACGAAQSFNMSSMWNPSNTGVYQLDSWADNLNGGADGDTSNDHFLQHIYVAPVLPARRIMFEEFKGTWCMWSGAYNHQYDSLISANSNKASSIKYEHSGYGFGLDDQDYWGRQNFYSVWAIPTSYMNGKLVTTDSAHFWPGFPGCPWNVTQEIIDSLYNLPGLFYIHPQLTLNGFTASVTASVTSAVNFQTMANCKIYVSIFEDTIAFSAPIGNSQESLFVNTSMKMLADAYGTYIGAPGIGHVDSINFSYSITDTAVNLSRLHVVVFVQDTVTKEIYQCGESPATIICTPVYHATRYDFCDGDSAYVNGIWRKESGTYPVFYTGANGCDSLQINIVRNHGMFSYIYASAGNITTFSGFGDTSTSFCWYDYLNQMAIPATFGTYHFVSPFHPTHSGLYSLVLNDQLGCSDTSNIVFSCSADSSYTGFIHHTLCPGDSIQIGGYWFPSYGNQINETNVYGCDSIINVQIDLDYVNTNLLLDHYLISASSNFASYQWYNCASSDPIAGATNYFFIGDQVYGGSYYCMITSYNGCSQSSECVTVQAPCPQLINRNRVLCDNDSVYFGSNWYSQQGTYIDSLIAVTGCDSIVTLHVYHLYIDSTLTINDDTMNAVAGYYNYTWIDCITNSQVSSSGSPIFIANVSGSYAVIIVDSYGCWARSVCTPVVITSLPEKAEDYRAELFPNPASDFTKLVFSGDVKNPSVDLVDLDGRILRSYSAIKNKLTSIDLENLSSGIYYVKVYNGNELLAIKLLAVIK